MEKTERGSTLAARIIKPLPRQQARERASSGTPSARDVSPTPMLVVRPPSGIVLVEELIVGELMLHRTHSQVVSR
jgi:hypothetical protein